MDVQSAANLNIPEGSVRNIHDKDKRLLWSAVGYDVTYRGDTSQTTYSGKNLWGGYNQYSRSISGMNYVTNSNGPITAQGIASADAYSITGQVAAQNNTCISLAAGTYYLSSKETLPVGVSLQVVETTNSITIRDGIGSFTLSETTTIAVRLKISSGTNLSNGITVYPQLKLGSTITAYEPYVGGIPAPNPNYPQDVNVVKGAQTVKVTGKNLACVNKSGSNHGITYTANGDGSLTMSGLSDSTSAYKVTETVADYMQLKAGQVYTVSANNLTINENITIRLTYYNGAVFNYGVKLNEINKIFTFTSSADVEVTVEMRISSGTNLSNGFVVKPQVELGSQATTYEQYQGQTFPVDLIGKNLFNRDALSLGSNWNGAIGSTCYPFITGQPARAVILVPTQGNTVYTIKLYASEWYSMQVIETNSSYIILKTHTVTPVGNEFTYTFTSMAETSYIGVKFKYGSAGTTVITQALLDELKLQLEKGSTATTYVPYYNYELCKIGNYQDYIYKGADGWYVHKETGAITLTGSASENWDLYVAGEVFRIRVLDMMGQDNQGITAPLYCKYYTPKAYSVITSSGRPDYGIAGRATSANGIAIRNKDCADVTAFKTWLSTYNTTVYYVLAASTDTKITDNTLIGQLNAIHDWLTRYDYYGNVTGNLPIIINRSGII